MYGDRSGDVDVGARPHHFMSQQEIFQTDEGIVNKNEILNKIFIFLLATLNHKETGIKK